MEKRLLLFLAGLFLSWGVVLAQTQISGTVVSQTDDEPVVGASIFVVGTKTGTITDIDGNFSLSVPDGKSQLRIQYIGMKTVVVNAKDGMKVRLEEESNGLDEVVVTGYGNFKKSSFTGSASTMDPGKLSDVPVVSMEDKLAGSVPGLSVTSNSSSPGAVSKVRIRGMGSINAGNEPLYVIDGTPVTSGDFSEFADSYNDTGTNIMSTLNSNDIESITVIKDAAAASLYGSRAANGVIVITTKSGKAGKTHVDFRSDWGFSNMAVNYRPTLSGDDRRSLIWTGLKNYGLYQEGMADGDANKFANDNIDDFAKMPDNGWTDWRDLLVKTGHHQNYQVALSGGTDKTKFYTSLSYMNQEGIFKGQGLERFTGAINLEHKFGRFTFNYNGQFSKMNQQKAGESTGYSSPLANVVWFQHPATEAYDKDGNLTKDTGSQINGGVNPLYELDHSTDNDQVFRALNSMKLTWNIWDNLNLSEKITYDYADGRENVVWDRHSNDGAPSGVMQRALSRNRQLNTQTQLSYVKSFGLNNLDALVGFETEENKYDYNYLSGHDYPGDLYELDNSGTQSAGSNKFGYKMTSVLGRLNYNYNNLYYLGLSMRTDGSSRLSKDNRWGTFWSVSASWRFGAEKFFQPYTDVISDGKIRFSYGTNGTQPSSYYSYMNLYKYGEYYNGASGMGIVGVGNTDLKWEKQKNFDLGLELTFFNRVSLTFDYYDRRSSDLIYDFPISATPGYYDSASPYSATMAKNIGELQNKGFELDITSNNISTKDLTWTTSFNIAHNSNKLSKLDGETNEVVDGRFLIHRVGEPYYSYYMYEYAGVDPQTGKEMYYVNGGDDPRATTTNEAEANKVIVAAHQPDVEGGLSNYIKYKFIDFNFNLTYSFGGKAYDGARWLHDNGGTFTSLGSIPSYYDINEMWTGPGDTNCSLPKFEYGSTQVVSSRWLMPTDYVRLKSMTLGLSAPQNYISRLGLSKARFYFSVSNLFTIKSKDLYVDPEMPVSGVALLETPALRTFTFGIELGF